MKKVKSEKSKKEKPKAAAVEPVMPADPKTSAKAVVRYLRISPRKARLVIDTIRFKPTEEAFTILMTFPRKAARMAEKLLKSAVANAKVLGMDENSLYVSDIRADGGPIMKRFRPRSMGRADRILKRTTHMSIVVKERKRHFTGSSAAGAGSASQQESTAKTKPAKKAKAGRGKKTAKAGAK